MIEKEELKVGEIDIGRGPISPIPIKVRTIRVHRSPIETETVLIPESRVNTGTVHGYASMPIRIQIP